MKRRNFLSLTASSLMLASLPMSLSAKDYRKVKPNVWKAHTVDDAIKAMYGSKKIEEKGVKIILPKVASNGGAVKVKFSTTISAKTISLFQDVNPESAVAVFTVGKYDLSDYEVRMKMAKSGTVTVVVEGLDGKLYVGKKSLDVAAGGCEG
jgi:sulfur-oxidizing protein SoxY